MTEINEQTAMAKVKTLSGDLRELALAECNPLTDQEAQAWIE